jgi:hypothetical protein
VLTEALVVAGISGALGLVMASALVSLVASVIPATLVDSSLNPLDLDLRAALWTLAAALAASIRPSIGRASPSSEASQSEMSEKGGRRRRG